MLRPARGYPPPYYHAESTAKQNRLFADRAKGVDNFDQSFVLHTAEQPGLRIETGVIVTRESEQMLASPESRQNIARAIAEGIAHCLTGRTRTQ